MRTSSILLVAILAGCGSSASHGPSSTEPPPPVEPPISVEPPPPEDDQPADPYAGACGEQDPPTDGRIVQWSPTLGTLADGTLVAAVLEGPSGCGAGLPRVFRLGEGGWSPLEASMGDGEFAREIALVHGASGPLVHVLLDGPEQRFIAMRAAGGGWQGSALADDRKMQWLAAAGDRVVAMVTRWSETEDGVGATHLQALEWQPAGWQPLGEEVVLGPGGRYSETYTVQALFAGDDIVALVEACRPIPPPRDLVLMECDRTVRTFRGGSWSAPSRRSRDPWFSIMGTPFATHEGGIAIAYGQSTDEERPRQQRGVVVQRQSGTAAFRATAPVLPGRTRFDNQPDALALRGDPLRIVWFDHAGEQVEHREIRAHALNGRRWTELAPPFAPTVPAGCQEHEMQLAAAWHGDTPVLLTTCAAERHLYRLENGQWTEATAP